MENSNVMPLVEAAVRYLNLRTPGMCKDHASKICMAVNGAVEICSRLYPNVMMITPEMLSEIEKQRHHHGCKLYDVLISREIRRFATWICNGYCDVGKLIRSRDKTLWESRLHSSLASLISLYIRRKQAARFVFARKDVFIHFDAMVAKEFPGATTVTREIAMRWVSLAQEGGVSINTAHVRISTIRCMCKYFRIHIDPSCYVIPASLPGKMVRYRGHLITEQELKAFFKRADALDYESHCPYRHITAPVVFRLMYACGLRVSEIRLLKREDISLSTGVIKIRESKAHAMRTVVMHPDMLEVMRHYDREIEKLFPSREWFFIDSTDSSQMHHSKVGRWFRFIWNNMEIDEKINEPQATARDFRHLYAMTVINRWYRAGKNPEGLDTWLVAYMGHQDFEMTSYYIHLEGSFAPDLAKIAERATGDLFDDFDEETFSQEVPYDA